LKGLFPLKTFKFRLQTVLERRQLQERMAQQGLASAEASFSRAEHLLADLREVQNALLAELSSRRSETFDPLETRTYQEYLQTIRDSIREQEAYVEGRAVERDAKKTELVRALNGRQALDAIKDKRHREYSVEQMRVEQRFSDELAMARFKKRMGEG
jgi:flagellar FliJ protein